MVCFCKNDYCNQYEYKDDLCCKKKNYIFNSYIFKMELCVENVSTATTNSNGVNTHLGNPNITELDGNTAITEANGEISQGETKADGAATKHGNLAETETGGAKSTLKPNSFNFSLLLFSTNVLILTSIFAM